MISYARTTSWMGWKMHYIICIVQSWMQTKSKKLKMLDFKIIDSRIVMREVQEF